MKNTTGFGSKILRALATLPMIILTVVFILPWAVIILLGKLLTVLLCSLTDYGFFGQWRWKENWRGSF